MEWISADTPPEPERYIEGMLIRADTYIVCFDKTRLWEEIKMEFGDDPEEEFGERRYVSTCIYHAEPGVWSTSTWDGEVTHWMPLPEPPEIGG